MPSWGRRANNLTNLPTSPIKDERDKGDERILESGDFVTGILKKAGEPFEMQSEEKSSLDLIIDTVTKHMGVTVEDLKSSSRKRKVVHARSIVTYAAVRGSGYKGSEVAEVLSLSRPTISACVEKERFFLTTTRR